ncbi:hypothetical protein AB5L97_12190 [Sinomonas sp. P10A9]|uniref:Uncharacterized protein n=1 Tax=Sinomonas puerhi TaxID=3238584 RepID=A0AB39KZF0_9MICC
MWAAQDRLNAGQQAFDLGLAAADPGAAPSLGSAVVAGTRCEVLWEALSDTHSRLGIDAIADEAFRSMVLTRIVEPASKLATIVILEDLGFPATHSNTLSAALKRCQALDYRDAVRGSSRFRGNGPAG